MAVMHFSYVSSSPYVHVNCVWGRDWWSPIQTAPESWRVPMNWGKWACVLSSYMYLISFGYEDLVDVISWYSWDHQLVILIISPKIKVTCRNSPAESSVARCPYIVWKTFCCRVVWWDIKRSKNHRNCERCLSISYSPGLKCHLDLYCPEGIG